MRLGLTEEAVASIIVEELITQIYQIRREKLEEAKPENDRLVASMKAVISYYTTEQEYKDLGIIDL